MKCEDGFREVGDWEPHSWISVISPDESDFEMLRNDFDVPIDYIEYIADNDENPRIERDGEWMLTILRIPVKTEDGSHPFSTIPLGILVNNEIIITLCYGHSEMIQDFIDHTRKKRINVNNSVNFIQHLNFSATVWYLKYLSQIRQSLNEAEKLLEKSISNQQIMNLMKLQRSLVVFNTALQGNETLVQRLSSIFSEDIDTDLREDVDIELKQARKSTEIYIEILNGMMDAFASVISNNVNDIMKRMTGISVILMVPTLIASFYGMNVDISLSSNPLAFWIIIGIAAVLTTLCFILFRKIHWF